MPDTTPTTELRRTLDRVAGLHDLDQGACGTCADADGQAAAWPCETAQQLQVAEQLLRAVEQPPARLVLGTTDQQPTTAPAATCSAEYHGDEDGARLCIRAAQHTGRAHTDERGYHWSDTVAVYPVADGTFRTGVDLRAALRRVADEAQPAADQPDPVGLCADCGVPRETHHGYVRTPGFDEEQQARAADQPDTETEAAK